MRNERELYLTSQIDEDLENWKQYYRDRKKQRITFSLEGKYRPDRKDIDYEEEAPPPANKPVNVHLAVKYEKAITQLPFTHEACLVIDYMYRWALSDKHFNKTCRIAKVSPKSWNETVKKAKLMLINRMQKH
ncbi:MAG: hypothetical protein V4605_04940 [Pseudomonadota bacterium]